MAAVATIVGVAGVSIAAGLSAWAGAGMVLLALFALQFGMVVYVVVEANRRDPRCGPAARRSNHAIVLPE